MTTDEARRMLREGLRSFIGYEVITHEGDFITSEICDGIDDAQALAELRSHGDPTVIYEIYIYQQGGRHKTLEGSWGYKGKEHTYVPSGKQKQRRFLAALQRSKEDAHNVIDTESTEFEDTSGDPEGPSVFSL